MSVALSLRDREAEALRAELADASAPDLARVVEKLDRLLTPRAHEPIPGQTTIEDFTGGGFTHGGE